MSSNNLDIFPINDNANSSNAADLHAPGEFPSIEDIEAEKDDHKMETEVPPAKNEHSLVLDEFPPIESFGVAEVAPEEASSEVTENKERTLTLNNQSQLSSNNEQTNQELQVSKSVNSNDPEFLQMWNKKKEQIILERTKESNRLNELIKEKAQKEIEQVNIEYENQLALNNDPSKITLNNRSALENHHGWEKVFECITRADEDAVSTEPKKEYFRLMRELKDCGESSEATNIF